MILKGNKVSLNSNLIRKVVYKDDYLIVVYSDSSIDWVTTGSLHPDLEKQILDEKLYKQLMYTYFS